MSAAHTPGPWVKDRYNQLRGPNGVQVGVWDAGISWVSRDDEAEANARLIGAAPDLLEALKAMKRAGLREGISASEQAGLDLIYEQACAAIAKATTAIDPNSVGTPQGVNQND